MNTLQALASIGVILVAGAFVTARPETRAPMPAASPIYGVTLPEGYRQWALVAPALEAAPLKEIRAVLGNGIALDAYRRGATVVEGSRGLYAEAGVHAGVQECEQHSARSF